MARYSSISVLNDDGGKRYYKGVIYPEIPFSFEDQYVITNEGDRFDILANRYYDDSSLWWVISIANRELNQNSYYITPGTQIRIPSGIRSIVAEYESLNS